MRPELRAIKTSLGCIITVVTAIIVQYVLHLQILGSQEPTPTPVHDLANFYKCLISDSLLRCVCTSGFLVNSIHFYFKSIPM